MLELPADRCVWVLIFDGMRLDAWDEVVRPELTKHFAIKGERLYLCSLPSFTRIARRSLLAGALPDKWQGYDGSFSNDERILVGKLFGLPKSELKNRLNLSDEDKKDPQLALDLDSARKRVNILIYRLSDKWIHSFEGDLCELNEALRGKLKNMLPSLLSRIKPGDLALVTSDHGFIELSEEGHVNVLQSEQGSKLAKESVFYRYLTDIVPDQGVPVQYDDRYRFTLPVGRRWYARDKREPPRYTHGGISMAEMVVPGTLLERITHPVRQLALEVTGTLFVVEDEPVILSATVENIGNQSGKYTLAYYANTGEAEHIPGSVSPQDIASHEFEIKHASPKLRSIKVDLEYRDIQDQIQRITRYVSVNIQLSKDKVEIDTGALSAFDEV